VERVLQLGYLRKGRSGLAECLFHSMRARLILALGVYYFLKGILFMQLKTASAIVIACLLIGALLSLAGSIAGAIWMHHWYLSMGITKPGLSMFWSTAASVVGVLLFQGPLILFFVVFYRNQTKDALSHQMP
jgi:hypothetical protein